MGELKDGQVHSLGSLQAGSPGASQKKLIKIKRRKKKKKNRCILTSTAPPIKLELSAGQYTADFGDSFDVSDCDTSKKDG